MILPVIKYINRWHLPSFAWRESDCNIGLGLSISYGIIRKYGGTITVRNHEDRGCQFRLRFPIPGSPTADPSA
jgi:signal transduction histidine kinase